MEANCFSAGKRSNSITPSEKSTPFSLTNPPPSKIFIAPPSNSTAPDLKSQSFARIGTTCPMTNARSITNPLKKTKHIAKITFVIILILMGNSWQKSKIRRENSYPNSFKLNQPNSNLEECLCLIEAKWQRGRREEWSSYDFERLNTAIMDATGVSLSARP